MLHALHDKLLQVIRVSTESGQTMAEYAIVLGAIVPFVVLALQLLGIEVMKPIQSVARLLP